MPPLVPKLPEGTEHYGVLARFDGTQAIFRACEKVRDAGYTRWDAHTPFPVHGLDDAMGLKASKLPWLCLATGLSGATIGMLMQWWVHTQGYPLVISGKPLFSWQAFVPVTFELGILFGALGAVLGMLAFNQLPMLYHPLFRSKQFERVTDDGFFISIESWDPKFDAAQTSKFLEEAGAAHVELVAP
jgi:hypothetical protein